MDFLPLLLVAGSPPTPALLPTYTLFVTVIALMVSFVTLVRTDFGLGILIFSMLLSPEIPLAAGLTVHRNVVLRIDDILIGVVTLTWLAKMALVKELPIFRRTPLNGPIALYTGLCILVTLFQVIVGGVKLNVCTFYLLKYIEYFVLFFMFVNNFTGRKEQHRFFFGCFFLTYLMVVLHAYTQIGKVVRVSAPFEGPVPEPNTLGGYLFFAMAILLGLFLYGRHPTQWLYGFLFLLGIPPFLFTLSRSGLTGFLAMGLATLFFTKKKRILLITACLFLLLLTPMVPRTVAERIKFTFTGPQVYRILGAEIELEPSAASRIESWRNVFRLWQKKPFFGYGVTGLPFVDSMYVRTLGELGLIGLLSFLWLLIRIFNTTRKTFMKIPLEAYQQGITLGFLGGFMGLLVQAVTTNTFIIVRIMEPFWFVAAFVMMLAGQRKDVAEAQLARESFKAA